MLLRFNSLLSTAIRPPRLCTNSIALGLRYPASLASRGHHNLTSRSSTRDNCLLAAMAPKQATLGYVKSSQTTLGCGDTVRHHRVMLPILTSLCRKFFGNANGALPKQQSKLSFSTKPKTENKDTEAGPDPRSSPEHVKTEPRPSADVKDEINGDVMEVDSSSSETGKKRPVKEEEEDSEDAPPMKRQRRKPAKDSGSAKKPKIAQSKTEKVPAKAKKVAAKAKPVVPEDDDDEVAAPTKTVKGQKKDIEKSPAPSAVDDEGSAKEEEDILTSDEEPEEIKKKAREKIQTTLKSNAKDPYPDWKAGEPVPYAALCTTFSKIEMTTKRLEILAHCSLFLRQVLRLTPSDLLPTTLLMINKLAADYTGVELGIGESLIKKAISESTGRSLQHISSDHNEIGDLGLVAAKSRSKQPTMFKPKPLTVQGVHKGLLTIATIEGQGAQGRKVDSIKKLLSSADAHNAGKQIDIEEDKGGPSESKFIVRTLEGKLRLGLAERTVVVALAQAMIFHEMSQKNTIPSTADLATGESILKTVYRLVSSL
jgi:DNA ligase-1